MAAFKYNQCFTRHIKHTESYKHVTMQRCVSCNLNFLKPRKLESKLKLPALLFRPDVIIGINYTFVVYDTSLREMSMVIHFFPFHLN